MQKLLRPFIGRRFTALRKLFRERPFAVSHGGWPLALLLPFLFDAPGSMLLGQVRSHLTKTSITRLAARAQGRRVVLPHQAQRSVLNIGAQSRRNVLESQARLAAQPPAVLLTRVRLDNVKSLLPGGLRVAKRGNLSFLHLTR